MRHEGCVRAGCSGHSWLHMLPPAYRDRDQNACLAYATRSGCCALADFSV